MIITMRAPIVILLTIIFIAVITVASRVFRKMSRQVKILSRQIEELNTEIEASKRQESQAGSVQQAYIQFIYNLSHEVSNPLQSIQTNLENMAECSPDEIVRWKQYYEIIRHEMKRLFTLTENLRLLSQLESITHPVKREPVNLKSVIEDVIMAQADRAATKNIILNYQGPNR